jgi:hypothetical protein
MPKAGTNATQKIETPQLCERMASLTRYAVPDVVAVAKLREGLEGDADAAGNA